MTSLDILEECLERIYVCRKNILAEKSRSFALKLDKRRRKRPPSSTSSSMKSSGFPKTYSFDPDSEGPRSNGRSISIAPKNKNNASSSVSKNNKNNNSNNNTDNEKDPDLSPNDLTATVIFDEFRTELLAWWTENAPSKPSKNSKGKRALTREDEDFRTEFADYLTDKYLSSKLDPLVSSIIVTKIRKTLSKIIEEFSNDGIIPIGIDEMEFTESSVNNINPMKKMSGNSLVSNLKNSENQINNDLYNNKNENIYNDNGDKVSERGSGNNMEDSGPKVKNTRRQKFELEKKTMKEQYAQYMKKNKNENGRNVINDIESRENHIELLENPESTNESNSNNDRNSQKNYDKNSQKNNSYSNNSIQKNNHNNSQKNDDYDNYNKNKSNLKKVVSDDETNKIASTDDRNKTNKNNVRMDLKISEKEKEKIKGKKEKENEDIDEDRNSAVAADYASLNSDIRSLLSSIQKPKI